MQQLLYYVDTGTDFDDLGDTLNEKIGRTAEKFARNMERNTRFARELYAVLAPRVTFAWATARHFAERMSASEEIHVVAAKPIVEADVMSGETQWERATESLYAACESAGAADRLQAAASEQVEAAHYALQRILEDLEAVMSVPSPAPASATVHTFETPQVIGPVRGRALAA